MSHCWAKYFVPKLRPSPNGHTEQWKHSQIYSSRGSRFCSFLCEEIHRNVCLERTRTFGSCPQAAAAEQIHMPRSDTLSPTNPIGIPSRIRAASDSRQSRRDGSRFHNSPNSWEHQLTTTTTICILCTLPASKGSRLARALPIPLREDDAVKPAKPKLLDAIMHAFPPICHNVNFSSPCPHFPKIPFPKINK